MKRAVQRAQEGLPPNETRRAYETIFFAAQQLHFERDNPRAVADLIISNDPKSANCTERERRIIEGERGAAKALNLNPSTLRSRMKNLGIKRPDRTSPQPS